MSKSYPYLSESQNNIRLSLKKDKNKCWWVYILHCEDGTLYTGITNNPIQRFVDHCESRGAKYTKNNPPKEIMYLESAPDKSQASKREYAIKQLTRKDKWVLIEEHDIPDDFKIKVQSK